MEVERVLIDTNIYSEFMRGNTKVKDIIKTVDLIGISVITIGELLSGFKAGIDQKKNRKELEAFISSPRVKVYQIDINTSEFYAKIVTELRGAGNPIPANNVWIAAIAFQHGLKLFTLDNHFQKIPGLFLLDY